MSQATLMYVAIAVSIATSVTLLALLMRPLLEARRVARVVRDLLARVDIGDMIRQLHEHAMSEAQKREDETGAIYAFEDRRELVERISELEGELVDARQRRDRAEAGFYREREQTIALTEALQGQVCDSADPYSYGDTCEGFDPFVLTGEKTTGFLRMTVQRGFIMRRVVVSAIDIDTGKPADVYVTMVKLGCEILMHGIVPVAVFAPVFVPSEKARYPGEYSPVFNADARCGNLIEVSIVRPTGESHSPRIRITGCVLGMSGELARKLEAERGEMRRARQVLRDATTILDMDDAPRRRGRPRKVPTEGATAPDGAADLGERLATLAGATATPETAGNDEAPPGPARGSTPPGADGGTRVGRPTGALGIAPQDDETTAHAED